MFDLEVKVALKIKAKLGECPRWHARENKLYWTDINNFRLNRFDPATGRNEYLQFDEEVGCFAFRKKGGFVLAMRSGFYLLDGWDINRQFICDPEADLAQTRFNDGRCDAKGRLIAGSYYPPKDYDGANIWSFDGSAKAHCLADDMLTSNGIAFSPDNSTLYYSDTPKHCIYACDYDLASGETSNRRIFHQFPLGKGRPDGASVDVEGNYWAALYEGARVVKLNPSGEIIQEISVPARCPTMLAFGGEDLKSVFVTSVGDRPQDELSSYPDSGAIFSFRVEVPGLPEFDFLA